MQGHLPTPSPKALDRRLVFRHAGQEGGHHVAVPRAVLPPHHYDIAVQDARPRHRLAGHPEAEMLPALGEANGHGEVLLDVLGRNDWRYGCDTAEDRDDHAFGPGALIGQPDGPGLGGVLVEQALAL